MPENNEVIGKIGGTILLILVVLFSNAFIMASFPQNFLANSDTIFNFNGNILSFQSVDEHGATIILNANQESVKNRDVIAMGGMHSVILTGKQVSVGENKFFTGHVTIPTRLNHIILFEQSTLELKDDLKEIEINFRTQNISLKNEFEDIYLISDGLNSYNIQLPTGSTTYITDKDNEALFKIHHTEGKIEISLVGSYPNEEFTITTKEEMIL
ncbi:hypothetical protein KAU33_02375 [Candidatus Dependentiae bacterium]|nr:hypothetical protein [Candidatus Dependentiae bacterium]